MTTFYIDGDACPVRDESFRVATRLNLPTIVVSNGSRPIRPPGLPNVSMIVVAGTPDAADDWIAERIGPTDLCATADIPLAARCLARKARCLNWTGHIWTEANIGNALAGREVSRHLRELGVGGSANAPLTKADRSRYLSTLDTLAHAALRAPPPAG